MSSETHQRFASILRDIKCPYEFILGVLDEESGRLFLQVWEETVIVGSPGERGMVKGRKWALSEHMTDGEVVQTAFLACKVYEEHELREAFLYKGHQIFNPHLDLETMIANAGNTEKREELATTGS